VQAKPQVEMAEVLHQNGKIYLVVLVLLTIFAGILFMLIRIERKLNHLEKEIK
jgi:preprotein translocase subunit YajC